MAEEKKVPGGMSEAELVAEMVSEFGWPKKRASEVSWPAKIAAVTNGRARLAREQEEVSRNDDPDLLDDVLADPVPILEHDLLVIDPDTNDYRFNNHAGAGPSSSHRWLDCTASLRLSRDHLLTLSPDQRAEVAMAGVAARQGTTAHTAAEAKLRHAFGQIDTEEFDTTLLDLAVSPPEGEEYDTEMDEFTDEYVDYVKMLADEGREVLVEVSLAATVELTGGKEGGVYEVRGSGDAVALPAPGHPRLVVADLKYGIGNDVSPEGNPQVRIYGLGALEHILDEDGQIPADLEEIEYVIAQPRLGGIKSWVESIDDLLQWRDEYLSPRLTAALFGPSEGAEFRPSADNCQFCPALGACRASAQQRVEEAAPLFDVLHEATLEGKEFDDVAGRIDDYLLGDLLAQGLSLVKITDALKAEAQGRLHRGEGVPGFKLVSYSPKRAWEDRAKDVMGEIPEAWEEPRLKSPRQVELLAKQGVIQIEDQDRFDALIKTPDKRPIIAPEGDRRKEWDGDLPEAAATKKVADMFDEIGD